MSNAKNKNLTKIFFIGLFLITVGMMTYFCLNNNNLATLINSIQTLNVFWLLIAFSSIFLYWLIDAKIIHLLSLFVYSKKSKYRDAIKVTMTGQYFNSVTPFAIAGQPMQLVAMIKKGIGSGTALSILVQKFLVYHITLTVYSLTIISINYGYFKERFPGFIVLALIGFLAQSFFVVLLFLFSLNRKITVALIKFVFNLLNKIRIIKNPETTSLKVETQLEYYLKNNKSISKNINLSFKLYILTFFQLTTFYLVSFFIYKAFNNLGFPIFDMISLGSFLMMISSYTPLPGSAGTSEGAFLVLFSTFFNHSIIDQAMLLWRFITYYSSIIFGVFFVGDIIKYKKSDNVTISNLEDIMN